MPSSLARRPKNNRTACRPGRTQLSVSNRRPSEFGLPPSAGLSEPSKTRGTKPATQHGRDGREAMRCATRLAPRVWIGENSLDRGRDQVAPTILQALGITPTQENTQALPSQFGLTKPRPSCETAGVRYSMLLRSLPRCSASERLRESEGLEVVARQT